MAKRLLGRMCLVLCALSVASSALASRVSPMALDIAPYGRESVGRVQFVNTSNREYPVEARVFLGEISEDGELALMPADDEFVVFPPQLVLPPLGEQVFRVQYVGEPELDRARVYYLSLQQLPVELEAGPPQVQVLVNFNVFINVEPEGTSAVARVDTVTTETRDNVAGVLVRVANDGNGMLLAGQLAWRLVGTTKSGEPFERKFTPAELGTIVGVGVVAPGKTRKFFFPLDADIELASVSAELK